MSTEVGRDRDIADMLAHDAVPIGAALGGPGAGGGGGGGGDGEWRSASISVSVPGNGTPKCQLWTTGGLIAVLAVVSVRVGERPTALCRRHPDCSLILCVCCMVCVLCSVHSVGGV
jgi:hypothetical protein